MKNKVDHNTEELFETAGVALNANEKSLIAAQDYDDIKANLIATFYTAKINDRSAKKLDLSTKVVAGATVILAVFTGILAWTAFMQMAALAKH